MNIALFLLRMLRMGLILFIILFLITWVFQYASHVEKYPTMMKLINFERQIANPVIKQIKMTIPYQFEGTDYSKGIFFVLLLIVLNFCSYLKIRTEIIVFRLKEKAEYANWRKHISRSMPKEKLSEIDTKFQKLSGTKTNDRKKILEEFAILKGKLDSMGQQLAFLSIDVVDSTGMKRNEDKHLVAYDFDRYNQCAYECLNENGVVKYATTPDGIMSCFRTVDAAVKAAVSLLKKLKNFNEHEKKIKRNFQIRCGINAGFVYIDDETPLEKVSDRVIDIAGHMQKYAKPDTINIAASAIEPLKNREGFYETTDIIDEQRVYEWTDR